MPKYDVSLAWVDNGLLLQRFNATLHKILQSLATFLYAQTLIQVRIRFMAKVSGGFGNGSKVFDFKASHLQKTLFSDSNVESSERK